MFGRAEIRCDLEQVVDEDKYALASPRIQPRLDGPSFSGARHISSACPPSIYAVWLKLLGRAQRCGC